jgi:hypothetical protein
MDLDVVSAGGAYQDDLVIKDEALSGLDVQVLVDNHDLSGVVRVVRVTLGRVVPDGFQRVCSAEEAEHAVTFILGP